MLARRPDLPPLPDPPEATAATRLGGVASILVGGMLGGLLMLGALRLLDSFPRGELLVGALVGVPLVLAVHELGHVVGGRLAGWRFMLFVAGPLRVAREGDRVRWGLNRSLTLAGGLALSLPTDGRDLVRRMALVVAGGPVASLLLGGLGLAVGPEVPGAGVARVVGLASLGIALVTLLPMRTGGFLTDGARLLRLARSGPIAEREATVLAAIAEMMAGVRPRDWEASGLDAALVLADGDVMEESALSLATSRALDRGDVEAAHAFLVRRVALWGVVPTAVRGGLATDAALVEAAVRGDADRARAWLAEVPTRAVLADPAAPPLVEAFIAHAEGDDDAARTHAEAALDAAHTGLGAGMAEARADWLDAAGL